jgi:hypothetical protein
LFSVGAAFDSADEVDVAVRVGGAEAVGAEGVERVPVGGGEGVAGVDDEAVEEAIGCMNGGRGGDRGRWGVRGRRRGLGRWEEGEAGVDVKGVRGVALDEGDVGDGEAQGLPAGAEVGEEVLGGGGGLGLGEGEVGGEGVGALLLVAEGEAQAQGLVEGS